jgi:glycosyltransferase involved in cell wall biosynthesis
MLSIIIPTYNRKQLLAESLESLTQQSIDSSDFEVIVVNDGGVDVRAVIQRFNSSLNINYINASHQGVSIARNTGIKEARGDILVFFDDDAVASKDWLEKVIKIFSNSEINIVVGRGLAKTNNMWQFFAPHYDRGNKQIQLNGIWECDFAVRKSVLNQVGVFDEQIGWGHEGNELADRCKKGGYDIWYQPSMVIYHDYATGIINYLKKQFLFGKKLAYLKKKGIDTEQFKESLYNDKLEKLNTIKKIFIKVIARLGAWSNNLGYKMNQ